MRKCEQCGQRLRRIHRTFLERFRYMAIYECHSCNREEYMPRRYALHLGEECRCPRCGTTRITKLKERDQIDPMETGFLNLLERLAGGRLYHCRFCRLQFYDRRPQAERGTPAEPEAVASPPGTATPDA